jgi:hypothetical protein
VLAVVVLVDAEELVALPDKVVEVEVEVLTLTDYSKRRV